jgi:hypothetical protein
MITLKLGFVGISLAAAFLATTSVETQLSQDSEEMNPLRTLKAYTRAGSAYESQQGLSEATPVKYQDALEHFAPQCEATPCGVGAVISRAFPN